LLPLVALFLLDALLLQPFLPFLALFLFFFGKAVASFD
jgi:hypothetical protein